MRDSLSHDNAAMVMWYKHEIVRGHGGIERWRSGMTAWLPGMAGEDLLEGGGISILTLYVVTMRVQVW